MYLKVCCGKSSIQFSTESFICARCSIISNVEHCDWTQRSISSSKEFSIRSSMTHNDVLSLFLLFILFWLEFKVTVEKFSRIMLISTMFIVKQGAAAIGIGNINCRLAVKLRWHWLGLPSIGNMCLMNYYLHAGPAFNNFPQLFRKDFRLLYCKVVKIIYC